MKPIEFAFVDVYGEEVVRLSDASGMEGHFDCFKCNTHLYFIKVYDYVPLHYESLLRKCKDVTCHKCGSVYEHIQEEGEDMVVEKEGAFVDPAQLSLFS